MKTIFKIAKAELSLLFYSPIAWFLLVAFLFQCGLAYTGTVGDYLTRQEVGGRGLRYLTFLTSNIFTPPFGILPGLVSKLYLYLPLLTMGLISREISSGTIRLLYSSPIKVREIVLGKFLAMMMYNLLLILIILLIVLLGLFNIRSADAGLLLSGLLGIYLLLCAYSAIGLFMSCLTSYQVVAALSTLVVFAVLNYIGTLWQDIDFVRDLSYYLSISGRTEHMLRGLISTRDVLYFCVIIFMFLGFSVCKLQGDMESRPLFIRATRYVLILVAGLAVGYISLLPGFVGYLDTTVTRSMTLTPVSQQIVKETGDTSLEVTSYINLLDNHFWNGTPEKRNEDLARWENYLRFKPRIKFNYVYYYDSSEDKSLFKYNPGTTLRSLAERYAKSAHVDIDKFKTPAEIRKIIDLRPEHNRYVMQLKYNNRTTFLRLFNDPMVFPAEAETDAALKRLMLPAMPKIFFSQGELERSIEKAGDRHYRTIASNISFRYALVNQGFDVGTLSLKDQKIPQDISTLVIADPKIPFDTASLEKIQRYIAGGGNLLIAGEPGRGNVLNPILQPLGVQLMDGMLVQKSRDFSPDMIQPHLTAEAAGLTQKLRQAAEDDIRLSMPGAAALSYTEDGPFSIHALVVTDSIASWNKKVRPTGEAIQAAEDADHTSDNPFANDTKMKDTANPAWQDLAYEPEQGDQKGPLAAMVDLTRMINGKEQRIVVSGDADFLSNLELNRINIRTCNFDFSTGLFNWLSYGEFPIDDARPKSKDIRLKLTSGGLTTLRVFLLGILSGLLLVLGGIILIRRKRK